MYKILFRNILKSKEINSENVIKRWMSQKRKLKKIPMWQGDVIEVEYCTEEDYKGHYMILKERLAKDHRDLIEIRGNPYGSPRKGAFEVIWRHLFIF